MSASEGCSKEMLRLYLARELSYQYSEQVASHLIGCEACRRDLDILSTSVSPPTTKFAVDDGTAQSPTTAFLGQSSESDKSPVLQFSDSYVRLMQLVGNFDATSNSEKIGQYELREVIGRGGMGVVIRAEDTRLKRDVAIKILAPELSASSKARRRFEREARSAAAINHPNIVTIFEINQVEGLPFLVMEYLKGGDLWNRLKRTPPLTLVQILQISLQVSEALVAAHKVGVIHRDVKPANILLEEGVDRIKLTDFGLATANEDRSILTSKRDTVGTPAYLAPEIIRGEPASVQSDLFSFGCVMYSLVTGHSPFRGLNPIEVINKIANMEQKPLHEVDPTIPKSVSDIVEKLLKKDVRRRYQSAKEVRDDLRTQLALVNSMSTDAFAQLGQLSANGKLNYAIRRNRLGIAAALVATVMGFAGWMFLRPKGTEQWKFTNSAPNSKELDRRLTLRVASDGSTQYRTIGAALAATQPNSTIEIIDDASYEELVDISDAVKFAGLTLESKGKATIKPPTGKGSAVIVRHTPNVIIRNLKLVANKEQHCVLLEGNCSGLLLDKLTCNQPSTSEAGSIVFWFGAGGEPDRPVILRDLEIQFGALGVIVIGAGDLPSRSIRIHGCQFASSAELPRDYPASAITLEKSIEDLDVTGNTFISGPDGIRFRSMPADVGKNIRFSNNTFLRLRRWIWFEMASPQQQIRFERNLILETNPDPLTSEIREAVTSWFADNVWEANEEGVLTGLAKPVDKINLISRDPGSDKFLVPAPGSKLVDKIGRPIGAFKSDGSKVVTE